MSSYLGRHAELYDLFYAEKPYAHEAAFVDQLIRQHTAPREDRGKLLELACGTGRHALELERLGHDIVATDYSADMLACARRRGEQAESRVAFHEADMRRLADCPAIADRKFDAAYALFDSIGYVQTNEAVRDTFAGVARRLAPGGVFVFEFWHAAAMLRGYDPLRVRRWPTPEGELLRISETTLDCAKQLCHVRYEILDLSRDGRFERIVETQTNRYFLVQEMAALAESGGMTLITCYAGFSREPVDEKTWHVVAVARRTDFNPLA